MKKVLDSAMVAETFLQACIDAKVKGDEDSKLWLQNISIDSKSIVQVLANGLILTGRYGKAMVTTEKLVGCTVELLDSALNIEWVEDTFDTDTEEVEDTSDTFDTEDDEDEEDEEVE